ncbi:MAG: class I SAM-dependent methyltransferase [Geminicoccaceae bacterium]|nr:class I SAM-dependent methyltransferase [Geminicoccaceae bacterium]
MRRDRSEGRLPFLAGLFLICMAVLMLQILQTRILSVVSHYHLAFFAISMAMFGMTAGALLVYFRSAWFAAEHLGPQLVRSSAGFALATALSLLLLVTSVVFVHPGNLVLTSLVWLKLILVLAPPYLFAGVAVSLALTRSPWPVGLVYGVDLVGAATGCLVVLLLLDRVDALSAVLLVAAVGALAGWLFKSARLGSELAPPPGPLGRLRLLAHPAVIALLIGAAGLANAALHPRGLVPTVVRGHLEYLEHHDVVAWNSFSRILAQGGPVRPEPAVMWAASPAMPETRIEQRWVNIDGEAATVMYRFEGRDQTLDFLRYDLVNLAYAIRNEGRAAVIGVGGGRDLVSAWTFGFRDITGVEINPIFIRLLDRDFRTFNRLAEVPGVRLVVDEARSWFARTDERFDLVQMSMIDTWAATGAGAFSLSENGLYTVEGWRRFFDRLTASGIFTVSRWYDPADVNETGRLLSLAKAALLTRGAAEPERHIVLAAHDRIATIIVGREPLSAADIATLTETADRLRFRLLVAPGRPAASPVLARIVAAPDLESLHALARGFRLDLSPATDDRPFFFNQLRMSHPSAMLEAVRSHGTGVIRGNLQATITLALIIGLSALVVLVTMIAPALPTLRRAEPALAALGTIYFLFIGLGFMLVEIGLLQRLSVFLGHPVYGLAIGLFGIILSTGLGALASERLRLEASGRILLWSAALALVLFMLPVWFPPVAAAFEGATLPVRVSLCLLAIGPPGFLMGFAFPAGMRLVEAIDARPTPWFWAVNGAAGVLAAGIAVAVGIEAGISTSLRIAAICYLLVGATGVALSRLVGERSAGLGPAVGARLSARATRAGATGRG